MSQRQLQEQGQTFVPAPTSWQAFWNTVLRHYTPHGPYGVDEPPTGTGGLAGGLLGQVPFGGGLLKAIMAGAAASEQAGKTVRLPPKTGWFQNFLSTIGNTLGLVPITNPALSAAKLGVSAARGLAGAPEAFNTSWGEMLAGTGGTLAREALDRTGVFRGMQEEGRREDFGGPSLSFASRFNRYNQPGENPFTDPFTGRTPAWAGGPSTWNQPSSMWGVPRTNPDELLGP